MTTNGIADFWERHRTAIVVTAVCVGLWLLLILATHGVGAAWILLIFLAYWIPTGFALLVHKRNWMPVFIVNMFLGWTLIGWVVAFVMAAWVSEES